MVPHKNQVETYRSRVNKGRPIRNASQSPIAFQTVIYAIRCLPNAHYLTVKGLMIGTAC
jgi:hypothetical protein